MTYVGTIINDSATIVAEAGEEITTGPFTAVAFKDGALVAGTDALVPIGIMIAETNETVAVGEPVHVQVKEMSRWKAGDAFEAGDLLACDANGCAVKAAAGKFILAVALEAGIAGQVAKVQIVKAGFAA